MALNDRGEFLEHAHVHGHWYATSATWLKQEVQHGHDVLLDTLPWGIGLVLLPWMEQPLHVEW